MTDSEIWTQLYQKKKNVHLSQLYLLTELYTGYHCLSPSRLVSLHSKCIKQPWLKKNIRKDENTLHNSSGKTQKYNIKSKLNTRTRWMNRAYYKSLNTEDMKAVMPGNALFLCVNFVLLLNCTVLKPVLGADSLDKAWLTPYLQDTA